VDRGALLAAVLSRLDFWGRRWADADGAVESCGLAAAYRAACATVGQIVTVTGTDGSRVRGAATGVDSTGRLLVDVGGAVRPIGAGDVEHVRPAG
jgi:BirA family biotin operon repressor/biotin-[acetyl-CoA-carboxylase] ligase